VKKFIALAVAALGCALATGAAQAHGNVSWSIGINLPPVGTVISNVPVYAEPAPVYVPAPIYAPAPVVYAAPAPVYVAPPLIVAPRRAYYRPAPVYVQRPVVVRPVPVVYAPRHGGWNDGRWNDERRYRH